MSSTLYDICFRVTARGVSDLPAMQEVHKMFSQIAREHSASLYGLLVYVDEEVQKGADEPRMLLEYLEPVTDGRKKFFEVIRMPTNVFRSSGFKAKLETIASMHPELIVEDRSCVYPELALAGGSFELVFKCTDEFGKVRSTAVESLRALFGGASSVSVDKEGEQVTFVVTDFTQDIGEISNELDDCIYEMFMGCDLILKSMKFSIAGEFRNNEEPVSAASEIAVNKMTLGDF